MGSKERKRWVVRATFPCLATFIMLSAGIAQTSSADPLRAGTTTLVSTRADGSPADGAEPSVSADGRYVAFSSLDQLTQQDTDRASDVFRKDMLTGETILVSVEVPGIAKHRDNISPSISGDGSRVAYLSGYCYGYSPEASCYGIVAHVRDIPGSSTTVVSDTGDYADAIRLSRNGSWAIVGQSGCGWDDCWSYLVVANTTTGERKWVSSLCECSFLVGIGISGDGRYLAFETDSRLVPSDTDDTNDVYRIDRDADGNQTFDEPGKTAAVLVGILPGGESHISRAADISDDGNRIAFFGRDASDPLLTYLPYLRDVKQATTTLLAQSSQGAKGAGPTWNLTRLAVGGSTGERVAFSSYDALAPPDANPMMDVYLRDAALRSTRLVSVLPGGDQDVGEKHGAAISYDGRFVAFGSTRLVDDVNLERRVYLRDLEGSCGSVCVEQGSPETIPDPPFDVGRVCWETGYVGTYLETEAPMCHSDSGDVSAGPARAAREGLLVVGGWDYVYTQGLGLHTSFWVAGVYLSSATRIAPVSQGTVTVRADVSGEMVGNFERSLTLCLNLFQSDTLLSQDCVANDAYHTEPLRALTATAPVSDGSVHAEVVLRTSKDAGYSRIKVDSLRINWV